eukprot:7508118-Pyramimonas_sp.AAC.1
MPLPAGLRPSPQALLRQLLAMHAQSRPRAPTGSVEEPMALSISSPSTSSFSSSLLLHGSAVTLFAAAFP